MMKEPKRRGVKNFIKIKLASEVQLLNIGQDIKNNCYVLFTKKLF